MGLNMHFRLSVTESPLMDNNFELNFHVRQSGDSSRLACHASSCSGPGPLSRQDKPTLAP